MTVIVVLVAPGRSLQRPQGGLLACFGRVGPVVCWGFVVAAGWFRGRAGCGWGWGWLRFGWGACAGGVEGADLDLVEGPVGDRSHGVAGAG